MEGKIPIGSIAAEIVHQLVDAEKARHGKSKVSKRIIYKCLDTKYRRQWQKKHKDEDPDPDQEQSALVHFDKVIPTITLGGGTETVVEPGTAEHRSEVKPTPISTPVEQDLKSTEPEAVAPKAQPQESQVDPDQVLQEPSHKIRILLSWESLSEQMSRAHSPGIEWVWLSGVLDEKSKIVSNLKLERGEVLK